MGSEEAFAGTPVSRENGSTTAADYVLSVADFEATPSGMNWRWLLNDSAGSLVLEQPVALDTHTWQYDAFSDLYGCLSWLADPQRRISRESEIVADVGAWIGEHVLGDIGRILLDHAQDGVGCLVRVEIPDSARDLTFRPLEAAIVDGMPLALHGVTLVHVVRSTRKWPSPGKRPIGAALRILALFSLPDGASALNVRKERFELAELIRTFAAAHGLALELHVLQYGVTRQRLATICLDGDGWDVLHLSGHGRPGDFTLEREDGRPDAVPASELIELLAPLNRRVKLVTASVCSSADPIAREHQRLLGLEPAERTAARSPSADSGRPEQFTVLATELARRLRCAVMGMRFPVVDDFAVAFNRALFELLLVHRQPLASALALALPRAVVRPPTPMCPPLSVATPALFGEGALELRLTAPRGAPLVFDDDRLKLAGFPTQPARFVGRVAVMARINEALAPRSGRSGVLLHGMAGAGKTTAAVELSYLQEDNFRTLVWYRGPSGDEDISGSLFALAWALEQKLPGRPIAPVVGDAEELARIVPLLTELFERERILLVIDNLENLLDPEGQWKDDRWRTVLDALTDHRGLSRVILTSRIRPAGLDDRFLVEPLHALSVREAVLLARDLPHLGALIAGTAPGMPAEHGRTLVTHVLAAVQGHPKLLELADAQAADPRRLTNLLGDADALWETRGLVPEGFFAEDETTADAADYAIILHGWTRGITELLEPTARLFFQVLCRLEEEDRRDSVLDAVWPTLSRLSDLRETSEWRPALDLLRRQGLVAADSTGSDEAKYVVHPEVAESGKSQGDRSLGSAVDRLTADYWYDVVHDALHREAAQATGELILAAALAAVPYLSRARDNERLAELLSQVLSRDVTRPTAAALLPRLQQALEPLYDTNDALILARTHARALVKVDPKRGEEKLLELFEIAEQRGDHARASNLASDLRSRHRDTGRLESALQWADKGVAHARLANHGPWTQLASEATRLQILAMTGAFERIIADADQMLRRAAELPDGFDGDEGIEPWAVREFLLDTARLAAREGHHWEEVLRYGKLTAESERRRGAPELDQTHTSFNIAEALSHLGEEQRAQEMLVRCRRVYAEHEHYAGLGWTSTALAHLEHRSRQAEPVLALAREALRYMYLVDLTGDIAVAHHDMGVYLSEYTLEWDASIAHLLAGGLIRAVAGLAGRSESAAVVRDALTKNEAGNAPDRLGELSLLTDAVPGVRLEHVLGRLAPPERIQRELDLLLTDVG